MLPSIMVTWCTGSRNIRFQSSKICMGHGIDIFLVMVVMCTLVMTVRRSVVEEVFLGMIDKMEIQNVLL